MCYHLKNQNSEVPIHVRMDEEQTLFYLDFQKHLEEEIKKL